MRGKIPYRSYLTILVIFLVCPYSYAFKLDITPEKVIPGDVFLLTVQTDNAPDAEAEFLGNRVDFYQIEDNNLIALVPVDVNTPPGTHTISITLGKEVYTAEIIVQAHKFKTIELTLPEGKVTLSPENQKRAAREAALLKGIWSKNTFKSWNGRFTTPTGTEVSTAFGVKRVMNKKRTSVHRGVDFRGKTGTPVKAINSGTVVLTDELFFGGNTLVLNHGMGLYSVYMHLSGFNVSPGDNVSGEHVIGFVGSSGRATGPHLHLSVKLRGISVNPLSLFELEL